jgi:hypothetical protein
MLLQTVLPHAASNNKMYSSLSDIWYWMQAIRNASHAAVYLYVCMFMRHLLRMGSDDEHVDVL